MKNYTEQTQIVRWKAQQKKVDTALNWVEKEVAEFNAKRFEKFSITGNE